MSPYERKGLWRDDIQSKRGRKEERYKRKKMGVTALSEKQTNIPKLVLCINFMIIFSISAEEDSFGSKTTDELIKDIDILKVCIFQFNIDDSNQLDVSIISNFFLKSLHFFI